MSGWRHRREKRIRVWEVYGKTMKVRFTTVEGKLHYPTSPWQNHEGQTMDEFLQILRRKDPSLMYKEIK
jgi:hypothetical protein